jgi:PTS system nitrogen regulatory IIA component
VEDFDVAALAAYLHITPDQVHKLVKQDKLPARRVGGELRFAEAEIHHWLEDRIGISDDQQLQKVEAALHRSAPAHPVWRLTEFCSVDRIAVPMNSRTRGSAIRDMCQLATEGGLMWDAPAMAEAVLAREDLHPTALDNGVAMLHPRRPQTSILADSVIALGVTPQPLAFAGGGQLTDIFFLICSYDDAMHLRILARLSRVISSPDFLSNLRSATSPGEAHHLLGEAEQPLVETNG